MNSDFLSLVNRPGRYINSEWNSVHKIRSQGMTSLCLCFPDLYEVGASNLGIEILYHIVNARKDAVAERCYCPDLDMENILRSDNIPLFSLESNTSLKTFDIVGFSLQYELSFTNVLNMLDMAGIGLFSDKRGEDSPLIIAGGPVCSNSAPVKKFFDLFVIGEGEDVIIEIIDAVRELKSRGSKKVHLLEVLSRIEGVYVPGYEERKVSSRIVDIENSPYPVNQIVPYIQTVHNRFNMEISRGCVNRCKFCQATALYRKWRERPPGKIIPIIREGIKNTGYEQVSLSSLSVSSYSKIEELLKETEEICKQTDTFVSVPSLRCDSRSLKLLKYLVKPHRANLTFAIEAGSERLRDYIRKGVSDEDIFNTLSQLKLLGWKLIKFYFMLGLPTETNEDIESIVNLIRRIQKYIPGINLNITLSPFIPKPHTEFQYEKQESIDSVREKAVFIQKSIRRANFKMHNLHMSYLEGIFSRGDEKLNDVVYKVWSKGGKFDQWKERFNFGLWEQVLRECSIDPEEYFNAREPGSKLPWSHIQY